MIAELESFFRRCQYWLSTSSWGTALLGVRYEPAEDARGVLLVELEALTLTQLEELIAAGRMRTLERMMRLEEYRIFGMSRGKRQVLPEVKLPGARLFAVALLWTGPALLRLARAVLEDQFRPAARRTRARVHLRRELATVTAEVGLALGQPVVVARLPYPGVDRALRRLFLLARGSRLRDYEMWLCSQGEEPFVCLPMTTRASRRTLAGLWEDARRRAESFQAVEAVQARNPPAGCLRVMTYNVHSCKGTDGRISPARIAQVIAEHAPQVVALQELDDGVGRTGFVNQARQIAHHLEMQVHFHPAMEFRDGRYGNAVLSSLPLRLVKAEGLPRPRGPVEPRGALWVEVEWEGRTLHLINTHLGLFRFERLRQVEALLGPEWVGSVDGPLVLLGDFNFVPGTPEYRRTCQALVDVNAERGLKTWFGRYPVQALDHVFVSSEVEVLEVDAPRTPLTMVASDHLPLVVDVKL